MNIVVAGVSGAIGLPLIAALVRQGHTVTGMSRDKAKTQRLVDMGATVAIVNAFDGTAVEQALRRSQAEVVIDQLTALPKDPAGYAAAFPGDRKLRLEGGGNLHRAAQAVGVRRYLGSEYEWNGKLGSFGSRALRRRGETDVFARLSLRKLLRLNADRHNSSNIDTDVFPPVGRHMGSDSQG